MYEEISVGLYPYLGVSETLIEFFAVIGYDEKILKENQDFFTNQKNLKLTVISKILSETIHNQVNFDDIINKVYPDKPNIIQITHKEMKKLRSTNVIFSSCIDSINGKKKIFYSCYALRFYEKFIDENQIEYYVPKAFLIYSQYPYFSTFYSLCSKLEIYNEYYMEDQIPIEVLLYCLVNYIPSPIKNNIILNDFKPNIVIPKLAGYPYIDFDLCKLINTVSIKEFISAFILGFLEFDLVFFSPNLEKLNLFMYSLYVLNFPLTDSNYFWHIKSISQNKIHTLNEIIGTFFVGVNTDYSSNLVLRNANNINFFVNIENKKHLINYVPRNIEAEEANKILTYINKLLRHKEKNSYFLMDNLITLKRKLKRIKKEYKIKVAKNHLHSFFSVDSNINLLNRKIQEAFYDFIITILIELKKDINCNYSSVSIDISKNQIDNNDKYTEEEKLFLKHFKYTVKYISFFDNFISNFNSMDEFKVSFLVTDEIVNFKGNDKYKKLPVDTKYFKIIDRLYYSNIATNTINFNKLNEEYKVASKQDLINNSQNEAKNQLFVLDKNIIDDFLKYKKNKGFSKSLKRIDLKELNIKYIKMISIPSTIQNIYHKFLNQIYFTRYSIVYIYSIVFPFMPFSKNILFLTNFFYSFTKIKYFQRHYINILLKSMNKYYIVNQKKNHFKQLNYENFKNYCEIIKGYLIKNSILPNEEIFKFFENLKEKSKNQDIINIDEKNNENIFIYQYDQEENYINNIDKDIITKIENSLILDINGEKFKCYFKSHEIIFQLISMFFEDYYIRLNFDIEYINIKNIIEIIINLIYYLVQSDDLEIGCFLINVILVLKKYQTSLNLYRDKNKDKYKENNNNNLFYQNHLNNNNMNNIYSINHSNSEVNNKTFINDDLEDNEDISEFEYIDENNIFI